MCEKSLRCLIQRPPAIWIDVQCRTNQHPAMTQVNSCQKNPDPDQASFPWFSADFSDSQEPEVRHAGCDNWSHSH
jgi:hypothetical protein